MNTSKNVTQIIAKEGKQEIIVIREFEAPRELVYKTFADPTLVVQWMGSPEFKVKIENWDLRSHGSWRFIQTRPDGVQMFFNGCIHEATFPERIIRTNEFEGLPERGHVTLEFLTLEALKGNRCKATFHIIFKTVNDRNALIELNMAEEFKNDHLRLDNLLQTLS